ncbi:nucleocapsid protein [Wufeng Eothenomys melanogaster jeilongvirus 1]|uniref:Nucleocapsid n=1 Tax=Wufeng Eothenomys melanogaster jeilongvirus 1 TaxID=2928990 RepID=A0A8T9KLD5_9MONO|nr:nucleocapsid protein [Wufeng Eothenomys melanogaster jeilongvirus 1]
MIIMKNYDLGTRFLLTGSGFGLRKMANLTEVLGEFRNFKNNPPKRGTLSAGIQGLKRTVLVPVPMMKDPKGRFIFMTLCLQLVWSGSASPAIMTGAFLSLLSIFADNPSAMIRSLFNDPDVEIQFAEVSEADEDGIKLATRGRNMDAYEKEIGRMAMANPASGISVYPFLVKDYRRIIPKSSEDLQVAIQTVTAQIWILLTKAVTASATASDSENRRWQKYEQQRRADADYRLSDAWRTYARERIASDLSIRRYMVEILIDANKAAPPKARILELISDVGNYISEAGMAGFFLTIKYGIETKYPALALNELQADLATVLGLMKTYTTMGERAPFMVILENSEQTKFSPGSYPLLWSYAMGVGANLDRAVNNLNYTKGFLEQSFYDLGAHMVAKMEGSVNRTVAAELGLSEDQISQVKNLVNQDAGGTSQGSRNVTMKKYTSTPFNPDLVEGILEEEAEDEADEDLITPKSYKGTGYNSDPYPSSYDKEYSNTTKAVIEDLNPQRKAKNLSKMKADIDNILKMKAKPQGVPLPDSVSDDLKVKPPRPQSTDLDALNA